MTPTSSPAQQLFIDPAVFLLNRRIQAATDVKSLLSSLIELVKAVLKPGYCFIWLRREMIPGDWSAQTLARFQAPACLCGHVEADWLKPGTRSVANMNRGVLRTALIEARAYLVTPIIYQNTVLGWLGLGQPEQGSTYDSGQSVFLELLADQGGQALYCFWLETNLAAHVELLQQAYCQAIQTQETERRQLAENLHDETLQHLADISVRLGLIRSQKQGEPAALADLHNRVYNADRRLREIVRGMHPAILSDLGLIDAIIAFFESVPLMNGATTVSVLLVARGFGPCRLPDQGLELALYRFVQNAACNALSHAHPKQIRVRLCWDAEAVEVAVDDDGCGMRQTLEEAVRAGHFGLLSMRERIKAHSGSFYLYSQPGGGTLVRGRVALPTPSPAPQAVDRYLFELSGNANDPNQGRDVTLAS